MTPKRFIILLGVVFGHKVKFLGDVLLNRWPYLF